MIAKSVRGKPSTKEKGRNVNLENRRIGEKGAKKERGKTQNWAYLDKTYTIVTYPTNHERREPGTPGR